MKKNDLLCLQHFFSPLALEVEKRKFPCVLGATPRKGFFMSIYHKKNNFSLKTHFPYTQSIIYGNISLWV